MIRNLERFVTYDDDFKASASVTVDWDIKIWWFMNDDVTALNARCHD